MPDLCPSKNLCGSCDWSGLSYPVQIEEKSNILNSTFKDFLKTSPLTVIPSPVTGHYRNRMDFVIDFERRVGLREKGKWWKVLDGHTCFLSTELIETAFSTVRNWVKTTPITCYDRKKHIGSLRYVVIRSSINGSVMVNIVTSAPSDNLEKDLLIDEIRLLSENLPNTTVLWSVNATQSDVSFGNDINVIAGKGYLEETINNITYKISPNAFFQTNSYCSPLLQNVVVDFIKSVNPKKVLDLYCGTGFFSLPISTFAKVLGVEVIDEAIVDAKYNATQNNLTAQFRSEKAEDLSWAEEHFDLMLVDPPRSGLHKNVLTSILTKVPDNLVYVSCNFSRLRTELDTLKSVFDVVDIKAVDMFPHTPHVETICYLKKR